MNNFPLVPDQASTFAKQVDDIFLALTSLTVFFTILVFVLIIVLSIRYRRGSNVNRANPVHHNLAVELAWSFPPLALGLFMFAWNVKPYAEAFNPPADAEEIFVIGKRWMWHMQHSVNGIRENNELHVPMGRPFKLTIISQDVIHGFYVPDFRMKRDAMPGQYNTVWFQATKPGKHHLFCSEYCGTDHSQMGGWIYVMTPEDYNNWVKSGGTTTNKPTTPEQAGYDLFTQLACANCHKDKDSMRAPSLHNLYGKRRNLQNGQVATADDTYIRKAIRNPEETLLQGYNATMPSYKESLDEQQIHDLIMYIKSLGNGNSVTIEKASAPAAKPASSGTVVNGATNGGTAPTATPGAGAAGVQGSTSVPAANPGAAGTVGGNNSR
jgi:cytochrome c oxidase subunit II